MYQNPLFKFVVGKQVYFNTKNNKWELSKDSVAINPDYIIQIIPMKEHSELFDGKKVYQILTKLEQLMLISDMIDVYLSNL